MLLSFSSANLTFFLFELNLINFSAYCLGFYYAWGTPVLISNTEVKPRRANGSYPQWLQE